MFQLDHIRGVFLNWPSELDAVKAPGNWASKAQAFFYAARVLNEEWESTNLDLHARDGELLDESLVLRTQIQLPAQFCLAFCLELAIKAALVSQGKLAQLSSREPLPFGTHRLRDLAKEIDGFTTSPVEDEILQWASDMVRVGKYPGSRNPDDSKNGVPVSRSLTFLIGAVQPLYLRLMDIQAART